MSDVKVNNRIEGVGNNALDRFLSERSFIYLFIFHFIAGLILYRVEFLSTLHAYGTLVLGFYIAFVSIDRIKVLYICSYIIGSEVLWRMTDAMVFHEFGKYLIVATIIINSIVHGRSKKINILPLLYFLLLVPSIAYVDLDSFTQLRQNISFNLSGPLALMACVIYFSNIRVRRDQLKNFFLIFLCPILSIISITLFNLRKLDAEYFLQHGTSSSSAISGGFSPNQVSIVLGFGAFIVLVLLLLRMSSSKRTSFLLLAILLLCTSQSGLTFSRSGLFMVIVCFSSFIITLLLFGEIRGSLAVVSIFISILVYTIVLPSLDDFTKGAFKTRFSSLELTGRDRIIDVDFQTWDQNYFFGVGPGGSTEERMKSFNRVIAAHTEYSRALAEHGLLGLLSLSVLVIMMIGVVTKVTGGYEAAIKVSIVVWFVLFLSINAMRLALPSLLFGLLHMNFINLKRSKLH